MPPGRETEAGFPLNVLAVAVLGMGVILVFVFRRGRAPTDSYPQPREMGPSPAAGSAATAGTAAAAGLPPSAGTAGVGPSIAGDLAGGLAAGTGIVAGEEIARHLLGEHDVNSPPASEIPQEQHENDHLGGRDFGVSGASSWDDDDRASSGDDWT
jgi:hypothetical protein